MGLCDDPKLHVKPRVGIQYQHQPGTGWTGASLQVHAIPRGDSAGKSATARRLQWTLVAVIALPMLQTHGGGPRAAADRALRRAGAPERYRAPLVLPPLPGKVLPLPGQKLRGDGGDAALRGEAQRAARGLGGVGRLDGLRRLGGVGRSGGSARGSGGVRRSRESARGSGGIRRLGGMRRSGGSAQVGRECAGRAERADWADCAGVGRVRGLGEGGNGRGSAQENGAPKAPDAGPFMSPNPLRGPLVCQIWPFRPPVEPILGSSPVWGTLPLRWSS
jgi:hypothetical protein